MYNELFPSRSFQSRFYTLMGLVSAFWISIVITQSALCRPFSKIWLPEEAGRCGSLPKVVVATAACNLLLDAAIAALPVPIIWRLQMPLRRKISVSALLSLGVT